MEPPHWRSRGSGWCARKGVIRLDPDLADESRLYIFYCDILPVMQYYASMAHYYHMSMLRSIISVPSLRHCCSPYSLTSTYSWSSRGTHLSVSNQIFNFQVVHSRFTWNRKSIKAKVKTTAELRSLFASWRYFDACFPSAPSKLRNRAPYRVLWYWVAENIKNLVTSPLKLPTAELFNVSHSFVFTYSF